MNASEFQLPIGTQVGRYVVVEKLGKGGMGVVYKAFDPQLDRAIALKMVDLVGLKEKKAPRRRARLLREAQALAKLSHPNIVTVHDVGTFGENVFIAMELVEGKSLDVWVRQNRPTPEQILKVLLEAGRGLWAAHQAGIIHRDFKPQNVIIGNDGRVRVLDFGLACAVERSEEPNGEVGGARESDDPAECPPRSLEAVRVDRKLPSQPPSDGSIHDRETMVGSGEREEKAPDARSDPATPSSISSGGRYLYQPLTQCGALIGTPAYMSPEQHLSEPAETRSDQFSFCVVLHEMLYGQFPFPLEAKRDLIVDVVRGKTIPPPEDSKISRWVAGIIKRGLSVKPEDRFASMGALLCALESDPARSRRRHRLVWAMSALLVLAVFAPLGVWYWMNRHSLLCKGAEAKLAGIWDPVAQQAIQAAFLSTRQAYAVEIFARVRQGLTRTFDEWTRTYTEVCQATRIRGEQSEQVMDLRMRCLQQQLDQESALVRLFQKQDEQVLKKAIQLAAELPSVAECADTAALHKSFEGYGASLAPARKHEVDELQQRLSEIKVLLRAGKYQESLALATAAATRAKTLAFVPLQAELAFTLGDLQVALGDYQKAESLLEEAWVLAESSEMDGLKAQAISYLVFLTGYHQARPDHALWLSSKAAAAIQRTPNNERLWARWHSSVGTVLTLKGEYAKAEQEFHQAVDVLQKIYGPEHLEVASALNNLGNVLFQEKQVDKSLQCFERALQIKEKILGSEHPEIALPLNNIAHILQTQGQCQQALAYLGRALQIMQTSLGPAHRFVGYASIILGNVQRCLGQVGKARGSYQRGIGILEKSTRGAHPDLAEGYVQLGKLELEERAYGKAEEAFGRALAICESVECEPQMKPEAQFGLAQAMWNLAKDRKRAVDLAQTARINFSKLKESSAEIERVNQWLSSR